MKMPGMSFVSKQADSIVDAAKEQLGGVFALIAVIWVVYILDFIPYVQFSHWLALRPRQLIGLPGVVTMPFVHGGLAHILSNTVPLIITLITLVVLKPKTWPKVVGLLIVTSGALTWIFGEPTLIVGASALVLALVTFLVSPGGFLVGWWGYNRIRKQSKPYPYEIRMIPLVVSAVVGFFCLDNLFFNLVPVFAPMGGANVSWRAHWCGAIAGCIVAFFFIRAGQSDDIGQPETPKGSVTKKSFMEETFS